MSGLLQYGRNQHNLLPIRGRTTTSTPNGGGSNNINHGPTAIDMSWQVIDGICYFQGYFVAGFSASTPDYTCLPFRCLHPMAFRISTHGSYTRRETIGANSRTMYWETTASGNWGHYFWMVYETDCRL